MKEYSVKVDGNVIGKRRSERMYTHAVIAERKQEVLNRAPEGTPRLFVYSFAGSRQLALKASNAIWDKGAYARVGIVEVEVREIERRVRVRCQGLYLHTWAGSYGLPRATAKRCLKDAVVADTTCEDHVSVNNAAVQAEAARINEASNAEGQRRWAALHVAEYTGETCPILQALRKYGEGQTCSLHHDQDAKSDAWESSGTASPYDFEPREEGR